MLLNEVVHPFNKLTVYQEIVKHTLTKEYAPKSLMRQSEPEKVLELAIELMNHMAPMHHMTANSVVTRLATPLFHSTPRSKSHMDVLRELHGLVLQQPAMKKFMASDTEQKEAVEMWKTQLKPWLKAVHETAYNLNSLREYIRLAAESHTTVRGDPWKNSDHQDLTAATMKAALKELGVKV